jgi:4-carboxymuconolactone decarboxylase
MKKRLTLTASGQALTQRASRGSAPPPRSWQRLTRQYPNVVAAYDRLSEVCRRAGPLDEATVALVKLAVSIGAGAERTVHAHAKKALRAGVDAESLRQVALVALPTVGLPAALDALRWVDESVAEASNRDEAARRTTGHRLTAASR